MERRTSKYHTSLRCCSLWRIGGSVAAVSWSRWVLLLFSSINYYSSLFVVSSAPALHSQLSRFSSPDPCSLDRGSSPPGIFSFIQSASPSAYHTVFLCMQLYSAEEYWRIGSYNMMAPCYKLGILVQMYEPYCRIDWGERYYLELLSLGGAFR